MFENKSCVIVASHVISLALRRWLLRFFYKLYKMLSITIPSRTQSLRQTHSSSNIAVMKSFGTGRVYVKSHSCLVASVAVLLVTAIVFVYGTWGPNVQFLGVVNFSKTSPLQYGIMIDAGSTGSRVHVYKFAVANGDASPILQHEVFEQVKPGLSSYAQNPQQGVSSISSLLEIAKRSIPQEKWSETPLALKATAGLRLLPGKQAQVLLDGVNQLFKSSPFKIPKDPVMIMDGKDEGIYAWLTVNYLLDAIGKNTVGTIDLGGGSMQIAFSPEDPKTIKEAPDNYIQEIDVFQDRLKVYVHSYLGLGLMSARELILSGPKPGSTVEITSPCIPEGYSGDWSNSQTSYKIKGSVNGAEKFDACHKVAKSAIEGKINRPDELNRKIFYAFSYIFDRAAEHGIIHPEDGGIVSVGKYEDTARSVCKTTDHRTQDPFACMDLTIITSLLRDGFGFDRNLLLNIRKKINGKENSWALGATFSLMGETN